MPFDVRGWIEVTGLDPSQHLWLSAVSLTPFRLSGDAVSQRLFGLSKHPSGPALFPGRGVPSDCSEHVRAAVAHNAAFVTTHGEGDSGHSYATWRELLDSSLLSSSELEGSEWAEVFAIIKRFHTGLQYPPENIRIVAWANW